MGRLSRVRFAWPMILMVLALSGIGLATIFSATAPLGQAGRTLVVKQMTWCGFGLVLMSVFLFFDYHGLERWAPWLYVAAVVLLIAAWGVGKVTAGSRRWLEIGFMRLQPSEFAKLAIVFMLARWLQAGPSGSGSALKELLVPAGLVVLPMVLVAIQPDLGTAGVIGLVAASMVVFGGVGRRAIAGGGAAIALALTLVFVARDWLLMEYQKKRLATYFNPDFDPLGAGYHIIQSQIAIGSGGAFGKGFLQGSQTQLMFLPVKHTDFIFSVLAEEWGFLGCLTVLALFTLLFMTGLAVARKARDPFGSLAAFGCTAMLFWHVTINVGMVTGLVPVVGVPLSFLSYGGSSILTSFMAVAVMVNVSMRRFS